MSQADFGKRMGALGFAMSRQTVWKIERGTRALGLDELFAAAYVLGVSPLALVTPREDEVLHVGDGADPLGRRDLGDWWMTVDHPRPEVGGDEMERDLGRTCVNHYFKDVRAVAAMNEERERFLRLVLGSIRELPPEPKDQLKRELWRQKQWLEERAELDQLREEHSKDDPEEDER